MHIHIHVHVVPGAPEAVTVMDIGPTSVRLEWRFGDNGGAAINGIYVTFVTLESATEFVAIDIESEQTSAIVHGLKDNHQYILRLQAKNRIGKSWTSILCYIYIYIYIYTYIQGVLNGCCHLGAYWVFQFPLNTITAEFIILYKDSNLIDLASTRQAEQSPIRFKYLSLCKLYCQTTTQNVQIINSCGTLSQVPASP